MIDEINEFMKELVKKINKKFQEHKTRMAQIEAKLITMQKEIESLKQKIENENAKKIDKSILKELE